MNRQRGPFHYLLLVCVSLFLRGCGGEAAESEGRLPWNPDRTPPCEALEPLVLQDPLTGGEFHCLWCSREWAWAVAGSHPRLFLVIDLACKDLGSEAYVEIRDPTGSVVWRKKVIPGHRKTACVVLDDPAQGTYSVRLHGSRDLLPAGDLIREFRGSLYLKMFDHHGTLIPPSFD